MCLLPGCLEHFEPCGPSGTIEVPLFAWHIFLSLTTWCGWKSILWSPFMKRGKKIERQILFSRIENEIPDLRLAAADGGSWLWAESLNSEGLLNWFSWLPNPHNESLVFNAWYSLLGWVTNYWISWFLTQITIAQLTTIELPPDCWQTRVTVSDFKRLVMCPFNWIGLTEVYSIVGTVRPG